MRQIVCYDALTSGRTNIFLKDFFVYQDKDWFYYKDILFIDFYPSQNNIGASINIVTNTNVRMVFNFRIQDSHVAEFVYNYIIKLNAGEEIEFSNDEIEILDLPSPKLKKNKFFSRKLGDMNRVAAAVRVIAFIKFGVAIAQFINWLSTVLSMNYQVTNDFGMTNYMGPFGISTLFLTLFNELIIFVLIFGFSEVIQLLQDNKDK